MQLHIFARTPRTDHAVVEVDDAASSVAMLKRAVLTELRLDLAPNRVRLLREVEGARAVPLDSCDTLMNQGIREGSKVLVEVIDVQSAGPAVAPPLSFTEQCLGGEQYMVADLQHSPGITEPRPFYLTLQEHRQLLRFLCESPSDTPQMLLLVGPIKSGKSRIALEVVPRMLAALHAAAPHARRTPVPFSFAFPLNMPAEHAAQHLVEALTAFARGRGLQLNEAPGAGLKALPRVAAAVALHTHQAGGELWLLLDELGAPIVASTPSAADEFTHQLKALVGCCTPYARIVGTGSGMLSLLTAIRAARPNGFALWDAMAHMSLGRQPSAPAALAMAQGLHASYSARWPAAVAREITAERLLAVLARSAHGEVTSSRPALMAHLLSLLGDASSGEPPQALLASAQQAMLVKLQEESLQDAAVALQRMTLRQARQLRALAVEGGRLPEASDRMARFAGLLCEGSPPQLMPPYATLLRSLVTPSGRVTVHSKGEGSSGLALSPLVYDNIKAIATYAPLLRQDERAALSRLLLSVLVRNGIGIAAGPGEALRAPQSLAELQSIPAVQGLMAALNQAASEGCEEGGLRSQSYAALVKARHGGVAAQALFMKSVGVTLLLWMRHFEAHVFFPTELGQAGLTCAVVGEAVFAGRTAMVELRGGRAFVIGEHGVLQRVRPALPPIERAGAD